jgi:hypothetical protein
MVVRRVAAILTDKLPDPIFSDDPLKEHKDSTLFKWPNTTSQGLSLRVKRLCVSMLDYPENSGVWTASHWTNYNWYVCWYLSFIRMNKDMSFGFPELRTTVYQFHGIVAADFKQKFGDQYWADLLFFMVWDIPELTGILIPDVVNEAEVASIVSRGGTILRISKYSGEDCILENFSRSHTIYIDDNADNARELMKEQITKIFPLESSELGFTQAPGSESLGFP